jgi:four helix bundle protein
MGTYRDLTVYKKSFTLALDIHKICSGFPKAETFGIISQIKRSSKSVSASIAEGYRKRQYEAYFVSKISDADMENTETQVWLEFAKELNFINLSDYEILLERSNEVGNLLNHMINHPLKYMGSIEIIKAKK